MMIFSLVIAGFYSVMQLTTGASKSSLKNRIEVQKDSRRTHMKFVDEISCASQVIKPDIGSTSAYLALVDRNGRIAVYYQRPFDYPQEDGTSVKGYKLYMVSRDPTSGKVEDEREVATHIKRLAFTATSEGAVAISLTMFNKKEEFNLFTQITLKNYYAGDFIN